VEYEAGGRYNIAMNSRIADPSGRAIDRETGRADRVNAEAGLEDIASQPQSKKIGTLSFPVCNGAAIRDNTRRSEEIIRRRRPALLLCAGWSAPKAKDLRSITAVTKQARTVVLLEAEGISFRVFQGKKFQMGEGFVSKGQTATAANLCLLDKALPNRSFTFLRRQAVLLVCGEINILRGRPPDVEFRPDVPSSLKAKIQAPGVMILNPAHTRMGEAWVVNAKREWLSGGGRTYINASNWDLSVQRMPTPKLHTLWHNGQERIPAEPPVENKFLCYREWHLPKL
jgi:hypothetical protein